MSAGNCLHQIFEARARLNPQRVAVTASGEELTYGELDDRAERLAAVLRARGVGPDTLVGLCCEPGVALVVGMLGVLKAGGAYAPLDPAYPDDRLRLLLADVGAKTVVASGTGARRVAGEAVEVIPVDTSPPQTSHVGSPAPDPAGPRPAVRSDQLAYVIHTSGSTGTPKGVLVEHRNVVALFEAAAEYGFDEHDTWTLFHSASFDFSVWEIWGALLHGGRLVVVPPELARSTDGLLRLLTEERVTVLSQTPSAFRQLTLRGADALPSATALRLVFFGGERLDVAMLGPWFERYGDTRPALVNMYGITETTVHVTHRRITRADLDRSERSPIGRPLPGVRLTLHDAEGRLVADGTPGEIRVGGTGVARGYLNRPEDQAERFTGEGGARLYRSGDLARCDSDGELVYLGRIDDQIKVRGYRIEPHEVEGVIARHPVVAAVAVVAEDHGDGDSRLVAWVQPAAGPAGLSGDAERDQALREHAAASLPAHLCPSHYRFAHRLPLTPQRKVDRAALADRSWPAPTGTGGELTPSGPGVRERVTAVVEGALRAGPLPADRDIFELGATSLVFVRILAEVNKAFRLSLNGSELADIASVDRLVSVVNAASGEPGTKER